MIAPSKMTNDELCIAYEADIGDGELQGEIIARAWDISDIEGFVASNRVERLEKALIHLSWIGMGLLSTSNVSSAFAGRKILDQVKSMLGEGRLQQLLEKYPEAMGEFIDSEAGG